MSLEWSDLFAALGLCLVIEGMIPFVNPNALRRALALMLTLDNGSVRIAGGIAMVFGLAVLYFARH
ncbi:MAG: DUF2065 domain-containing protein [Pseudomonadota bacterium]